MKSLSAFTLAIAMIGCSSHIDNHDVRACEFDEYFFEATLSAAISEEDESAFFMHVNRYLQLEQASSGGKSARPATGEEVLMVYGLTDSSICTELLNDLEDLVNTQVSAHTCQCQNFESKILE